MSFQKCQKCDKPATHKFTRILEGKAVDFYFCQEHAAEFSPLQQKHQSQMNLAHLLAGLLKEEQGQKSEGEAATAVKCARCGLSFRQYRKTMLLGCSECYQAFEKHLAHDLRRYHGTVRHVGQPLPEEPDDEAQSEAEPSQESQVESLQKRLDLAIKDEDFELAAQLRDQIKRLKAEEKKQS